MLQGVVAQPPLRAQLDWQVAAPPHWRPQLLVQPVTLQVPVVAQLTAQLFPGQLIAQDLAPLHLSEQFPPGHERLQSAPS